MELVIILGSFFLLGWIFEKVVNEYSKKIIKESGVEIDLFWPRAFILVMFVIMYLILNDDRFFHVSTVIIISLITLLVLILTQKRIGLLRSVILSLLELTTGVFSICNKILGLTLILMSFMFQILFRTAAGGRYDEDDEDERESFFLTDIGFQLLKK